MIQILAHADPSGDWGLHHLLPLLAGFSGTFGAYLIVGRAAIRKGLHQAVAWSRAVLKQAGSLLRSFCTRRPH